MTTVDTNTLREQQAVNHRQNLDGKQVNLGFLGVALESDEKKASKQKTNTDETAQNTKSSKGKLTSVQNDMKLESTGSTQNLSDLEKDSEPKGFGSLLSSFADHWEPDPLVSFMFDNAPILLELCEKSLAAMTEAQNTQTNQQLQCSLLSAQDTVKKGQEQATQQVLKAAGEFAQAGTSALQTSLMVSDACIKTNTYGEDLDLHEGVLNNLKSKSQDDVGTSGKVGDKGSASPLSEEEADYVKNKAEEFKDLAQQKYEEKISELEKSFKTKMKQNNFFGGGRSVDSVEAENQVIAKRAASREAYSEVFAKEEDLKKFKGSDQQAVECRKAFMEELFSDESGNRIADMDERMDLIGDWGSKGRALRKEMLQTYGSTSEGKEMVRDFAGQRDLAAQKAGMESRDNERIASKRQLLLQGVLGNNMNGLFDLLQKSHIINSSNLESESALNSAFSQAWSQGQSGLKGVIDQLVQDLSSLMKWFDSAHGSLISAEIQG